jgi:hypothetical protein
VLFQGCANFKIPTCLCLIACVICRGFAVEVAARLVSADWLWNTTVNSTSNSSDSSGDNSSGEADGATLFEVIVAR